MPKKPPRHNPPNPDLRTVKSAASLLRRISQKAGGALPVLGGRPPTGISLTELIRQQLGEDLRPHLLEVRDKPGELVLFVDSAVWAGRLKLAADGLSAVAAGRRLIVRVMPPGGYRR